MLPLVATADIFTDLLLFDQTRTRTQVSFKNKYNLLKKLDALPGGAEWVCDEWEIVGNVEDEDGKMKTEEVELWRRDPVECIRELIGNPAFKDYLKYAPEKLFVDEEGKERMYEEMCISKAPNLLVNISEY